jgi:hypothetical protein
VQWGEMIRGEGRKRVVRVLVTGGSGVGVWILKVPCCIGPVN